MKLHHYLTLFFQINSKWIKDLNIIPEIVPFLKQNIGEKLHDTCLGNNYMGITSKVWAIQAKINKRHCIKLKSFYIAKETKE